MTTEPFHIMFIIIYLVFQSTICDTKILSLVVLIMASPSLTFFPFIGRIYIPIPWVLVGLVLGGLLVFQYSKLWFLKLNSKMQCSISCMHFSCHAINYPKWKHHIYVFSSRISTLPHFWVSQCQVLNIWVKVLLV